MTDAIVALDIKSGKVRWFHQLTPDDNWTLGCRAKNPDNPNCPETLGPDFDFSASPALVKAGGRDLLVVPQKSGMAYALDPDKQGAIVWQFRFGPGSGRGGQWGSATDGRQVYFGVNGNGAAAGGIVAVDLATGERVWQRPAEPPLCGAPGRDCSAAQGAAVTAIPGAVLSGRRRRRLARIRGRRRHACCGSSTPTANSPRSTGSRPGAAAWTDRARSSPADCCS